MKLINPPNEMTTTDRLLLLIVGQVQLLTALVAETTGKEDQVGKTMEHISATADTLAQELNSKT